MALYGYIKVPPHIPPDGPASPEVQLRYLERHAARRGLALDHVFPEKESSFGKPLGERPEGRRLLSAIGPGDRAVACRAEYLFGAPGEIPLVLTHFRRRGASLFLLDLGWEITRGDMTSRLYAVVDEASRARHARAARAPHPEKPAPLRLALRLPEAPLLPAS